MEPLPTKILITRHSFSCNQKEKVKKAFDPALTRNGIDMAMTRAKYASTSSGRLYDSDIVLVSCLLRTWQTALLLYNPEVAAQEFPEKRKFTLYVYPYLKEHLKVVRRGNYPTELKLTLANFLKFLEFIRENYLVYYSNCLPVHINIIIWGEGTPDLTFSLTRTTNDSPFEVIIDEIDCHGCWDMSQNTMINPFIDGSKFTEDGDLNNFVVDICGLPHGDKQKFEHNGTIHVVAHSSLMRTYLGSLETGVEVDVVNPLLIINDDQGHVHQSVSLSEIIRNVSETNMFSFEMECGGVSGPTLNKAYLGLSVPAPPTEKNRVLCDAGQFFDPNLVPRAKSEPKGEIYQVGETVQISGVRTGYNLKTGKIIGYYINGDLSGHDSDVENILGMTSDFFLKLKNSAAGPLNIYRVEFGKDDRENFCACNVNPEMDGTGGHSVTLSLKGGGRLKKSKQKNNKTKRNTKRKKNKKKSKRRGKSKRRKNTKRK
jgi:hypothetical protein